jgi:hypothetical protein
MEIIMEGNITNAQFTDAPTVKAQIGERVMMPADYLTMISLNTITGLLIF